MEPERSDTGVDLTLIRATLRMSPTERIRAHDSALPLFLELVRRARNPREFGTFSREMTLEDVIRAKERAGQPKDRAVLDVLRETLRERERREDA